jgi:hypothetical protein
MYLIVFMIYVWILDGSSIYLKFFAVLHYEEFFPILYLAISFNCYLTFLCSDFHRSQCECMCVGESQLLKSTYSLIALQFRGSVKVMYHLKFSPLGSGPF